ncbi:MAG TPA: DUF3489 domain-containing protein [Amaricoccus sp.]|uniref:DUF3489 domain-containing protein n=1 Tax=Amaricoccus sp. TaxID=1872485 RepID=UPI002B991DF7|nr:DUF3489 domain-containing protein [Amaricoccus sp.]HMR54496.1 DUF3489 domain-containing protein [Amaricoccus sp.]HMU00797.1 DUF3489 domain-containing protein [Amaricoccus sp.]
MTEYTTAQLSTILSALSGTIRNPNSKAAARKAIDRIAAILGLTGEAVLAAAPGLLDGRLDPACWREQLTAPPEPSHQEDEQSLVRIPREGTKQALVVSLLGREQGATLDELVAATGWLPHTTRAALTDLRRRGYSLQKDAREGGASSYSIQAG